MAMKIAITGDNHLDFLYNADGLVSTMFDEMASKGYDILVNLGDITNGRIHTKYYGLDRLLGNKTILYLLGNHDLWSPPFDKSRVPNEAFRWVIKWLSQYPAQPLETSFADHDTFWNDNTGKDECCIIGTIGFPDFEHPIYLYQKQMYDIRCCTNDGKYMDLSKGFLVHTKRMIASFEARLQKALAFSESKNIIIATHYSIFENQYKLSTDDISAYFFCHTLGEMVRKYARENPNRKFWCFSGHAHEYSKGKLFTESDNLAGMGLLAEYSKLAYVIIDTDAGFNQEVETHWIPKPCETIIETRETEAEGSQ